jgi:hypothetical protein
MLRLRSLLAIVFVLALSACASAGGGGAGGAGKGPITAEEIATANVPTAYEAVNRLRNAWFRDRVTGEAPLVYLDSRRQLNGVSSLRDVRAHEIAEIQFVPGNEAVNRWGLEAKSGAIVVLLR